MRLLDDSSATKNSVQYILRSPLLLRAQDSLGDDRRAHHFSNYNDIRKGKRLAEIPFQETDSYHEKLKHYYKIETKKSYEKFLQSIYKIQFPFFTV